LKPVYRLLERAMSIVVYTDFHGGSTSKLHRHHAISE